VRKDATAATLRVIVTEAGLTHMLGAAHDGLGLAEILEGAEVPRLPAGLCALLSPDSES
jgi:hypothetical protein